MLKKRFNFFKIRKYSKLIREHKFEELNCSFKHFENENNELKHYLFDSNSNIKKGFSIIFKTPNINEMNIPFIITSLLTSKISNIDNLLSNLKVKNEPLITSFSFYSNNEFELKEMSTFLLNHLLKPNWNDIHFEKDNYLKLLNIKSNLIDCVFKNEILKNLKLNIENEKEIELNLNLNEIKKYHSKYYSISNCLFISLGGNYLNENEFNWSNINQRIESNKKELNFLKKEITIETKGIENNHLIGLSYKMKNILDLNENEYYFYKIFFQFLISNNNGIFTKFNSYLLPESEYDLSFHQSFLNLYFDEIENIDTFTFEFNSFLNDLSNSNLLNKGILKNGSSGSDVIESLILNLEVYLKSILKNDLFNFISDFYKNDIDFLPYLKINSILNYLKKNMTNEILRSKMKELFLNNNEIFKIILLPDDNQSKQEENEEEGEIFNNFDFSNLIYRNYYSYFEKDQIFKTNIKKLKESIYFNEIESNGISNISIYSNINISNQSSSDMLLILPLTIKLIEKIGARGLNSIEFESKIEKLSSSFEIKPILIQDTNNNDSSEIGIILNFTCLSRNIYKMMDLVEAIFLESNIFENINDEDLLTDLIEYSIFIMESDVHNSFSNVMKWKCASNFSTSMRKYEILNGLSSLNFSKTYKSIPFKNLLEMLKNVSRKLLSKNKMKIVISSNEQYKTQILDSTSNFLNSLIELKEDEDVEEMDKILPMSKKEYFLVDSNITIISKCIKTIPFENNDFPCLKLISKLIQSNFKKEYLGTYFNHIQIDNSMSGYFSLVSENVKDIENSLNLFDTFVEYIIQNQFFDEDVENSKKNVMREMNNFDSHELSKLEIINGLSKEKMKKFKENLIKINRNDILRVTKQYLIGTPIYDENTQLNSSNNYFESLTVLSNDVSNTISNSKIWKVIKS
eukprot:gene5077-8677_t